MVKKEQAVVRADILYVDSIHKRKLSKDKRPTESKQEQCTRCRKFLPMPDRITLQKTLYVIDVKRNDIFNFSVNLRKQST